MNWGKMVETARQKVLRANSYVTREDLVGWLKAVYGLS